MWMGQKSPSESKQLREHFWIYKEQHDGVLFSTTIALSKMKAPSILAFAFALITLSSSVANAQLLGGLICFCEAGTRCALLGCYPCNAGSSSSGRSTTCAQCPAVSHLRF